MYYQKSMKIKRERQGIVLVDENRSLLYVPERGSGPSPEFHLRPSVIVSVPQKLGRRTSSAGRMLSTHKALRELEIARILVRILTSRQPSNVFVSPLENPTAWTQIPLPGKSRTKNSSFCGGSWMVVIQRTNCFRSAPLS